MDAAPRAHPWDPAAVVVGLLLPSVTVWLYFARLAGDATWLQQTAYAVGKVVQFGFPLAWWLTTRGQWPRLPLSSGRSVAEGLASGALILGAAFAAYGWLGAGDSLAASGRLIHGRLAQFGVGSLGEFVLVAAFYSLLHSFLEEYYWRWFVFGRLRALVGLGWALAVSSFGFMAHHVIVLSVYFGWGSPLSIWLSVAVAAGGAIWAWQYHRTGSLGAPWASHFLADVAVFAIGYDLVRPFLSG